MKPINIYTRDVFPYGILILLNNGHARNFGTQKRRKKARIVIEIYSSNKMKIRHVNAVI